MEVQRLLDEMKGDRGFILNLGHGVAPDTSQDAIKALVNCVRRKRPCLITSRS